MLKKAIKFSLIISLFFTTLIIAAGFLAKITKEKSLLEETTVPERVEYLEPTYIDFETMYKKVAKKLGKNPDIYSEEYQEMAERLIKRYKKKSYTIEKPLLILNPYGTNTTGLYIFFRHKYRVNTRYTVSVKEIDGDDSTKIGDFSASLYTNKAGLPLAEQEGQIIGLVKGEKNYISIYAYDENDKLIAKAGYKIDVPDSGTNMKILNVEYDRRINQLSSGLYAVFGLGEDGKRTKNIFLYDNYGIERAELPLRKSIEVKNLGLVDDNLFYQIEDGRFILVDRLGKIEKFFTLENGAKAYGDLDIENLKKKAVSLVKKASKDSIYSIDIFSGNTKKIVDLDSLFKEYLKNGNKLKFTSINFINENDLLLVEEETSSIIRLSNVFRNPKIKAIISGTNLLNTAEYRDVFYKRDGDFVLQDGIGNIYVEREQKGREYNIYLFNKNRQGRESFYYSYMVDKKNKRYSLVDNIAVPKSKSGGSVMLNERSIVILSTDDYSFYEYNLEGNKLASFRFKNGNTASRVFKLSMKGSWFAK